jgi:hypothetical protein
MNICPCFGTGNSLLKFLQAFQIQPVLTKRQMGRLDRWLCSLLPNLFVTNYTACDRNVTNCTTTTTGGGGGGDDGRGGGIAGAILFCGKILSFR